MKEIAAIIYQTNQNKYSFNALLGALETTKLLKEINVFFYKDGKDDLNILQDYISNHKKTIILFSFFTTQIWDVYAVIKKIKNQYDDKLIYLAGGPHPTGMPNETLDMGFDYVLLGEGEKSINDFFKALLMNETPNKIDGIAYIDENGKFIKNIKGTTINLNDYYPFSTQYKRFGPMEITRGCPYGCSFCQTTRIFGANVRHRKVEFIEENLDIMNHYGLKDFRAVTPNALSYGSYDGKTINLNEIHKLLITVKKKLSGKIYFGSFPSEVRPEHITEESVKLIKEFIDNDTIILGAQTGSTKMLEMCHRGHSIEDVYNAVDILIRHKLIPSVDFIFGLPGESKFDIDCSIKVMKDLINMGARIHAHTFMPLPQTPFMNKKEGTINNKVKNYISNYLHNGVVYGNWNEQAIMSEKISHYIRTKEF